MRFQSAAGVLGIVLGLSEGVRMPGQEVAKPGEVFCDQVNPPVRYGKLKRILVIVGEVIDVDEATSYSGSESLAVPQLFVKVQHAFSPGVPNELVIDMPFPGAPWKDRSLPSKGDQVIVTLQKERVTAGWSCGRLVPCGKRPGTRWVGIEIYKQLHWP